MFDDVGTPIRYIFCQIKLFLGFHLAIAFGIQTLYLIDFSKIHQIKGLKPNNTG